MTDVDLWSNLDYLKIMRYTFSLTSFLLALSILTAPAADPARPDFSGRWELDAAKSEGLILDSLSNVMMMTQLQRRAQLYDNPH